jgi:hypothetical protein
VIVNVAAMKAANLSRFSLAEARVKRHGRTYIAVKSHYYATNYQHIHIACTTRDYLESNSLPATVPLSVDRNYPSARSDVRTRARMVLRVNRD